MEQQGHYRHEQKYAITCPQYLELRNRLKAVMKPDAHVREDGRYQVRSIYFDNFSDKALKEKINGAVKREKFRIRYYNDDFSFLTLEKKMKCNNLCMKFDTPLSEEACRRLLAGEIAWMRGHPASLVQELYTKMQYQMLRPRVLVSYLREPYIYKAGNVRITFDFGIRTTLYHREFLENAVCDIPASVGCEEIVLEIKYDAFLPELIENMVQVGDMRQQAFSKYGVCRRFG